MDLVHLAHVKTQLQLLEGPRKGGNQPGGKNCSLSRERKTKMKNKALLFSGIGSSGKDENSYAHENDRLLGVALTDRFTDFTISFFK